MDLIERQAAIDAPEKFIKDCNPEHFLGYQMFIEFMDNAEIGSFGNWQFANGFNMGLTAAEVAIKELPSAPRWTPVTERLPEEDTDVLVTGENGELDIALWKCDSWTEDDVVVWEGSGFSYIDPVAWMPLPEPWKGEEDV